MAVYNSTPRKCIELILSSLIREHVNVRLETVDYQTSLFSIAIGSRIQDGPLGVAVAFRNPELVRIRDAINNILNQEPGDGERV